MSSVNDNASSPVPSDGVSKRKQGKNPSYPRDLGATGSGGFLDLCPPWKYAYPLPNLGIGYRVTIDNVLADL